MANRNTPLGLEVDRHGVGGVATRLNQYYIAAALAATLGTGSAVKPTGTSKQITAAAAGDKIVGVFFGCNYVDTGGNTQFRPNWVSGTTIQANTLVEASVQDDPFAMFRIQVSGTAFAANNLGFLADLLIGTVVTATGRSADMIDYTTITSSTPGGAGSQFLIDDVWAGSQSPEATAAFGQYGKAIVRCAKHYLGPTLVAE